MLIEMETGSAGGRCVGTGIRDQEEKPEEDEEERG